MASNSTDCKRFAETDINVLLQNKNCKSTSYKDTYANKLFNQFIQEDVTAQNLIVSDICNGQLDKLLAKFYASIRQNNGNYLKRNSILGIRYALARYFRQHGKEKPDIVNDPEFKESSEVFKCVLKRLKQTGSAATTHFKEVEKSDLKKISECLDHKSPVQLQFLVWFNLQLFLCKRGNENVCDMKKNSIVIKKNVSGRRYLCKAGDELTKNRRENEVENFGGVLCETKEERCPVLLFEMYLSKLNPANQFLWQIPKQKFFEKEETWYQNRKHGHNGLSTFMKQISKVCNLSQIYTNHSLRVTYISIAAEKFTENEIMSVSGHKSASCLGIYKRVREKTKEDMFNYVSENVQPTSSKQSKYENNLQKETAPKTCNMENTIIDLDKTIEMINDAEDEMNSQSENEMLAFVADKMEKQYLKNAPVFLQFAPKFVNCSNVTINFTK